MVASDQDKQTKAGDVDRASTAAKDGQPSGTSRLATLKDLAALIQTVIAAAAVIIGAIWTWHIFVLDDQAVPHADVSQTISQWKLSDKMRYVSAVFAIKNTGTTRLNLTCGQMYIQQILPNPEEDFTKSELDPFLNNREAQPLAIPWEVIESVTSDLSATKETIGPGETDHISVDFIIPADVKVAMVFGIFERDNPGCAIGKDGQTLRGTGMISRMVYKMSDDENGGS